MRDSTIHIVLIIFLLHSCSKEPYDYENDKTSYYKNLTSEYDSDSLISCLTYNIQLGFKANQDPWNNDEIGGTNEQLDNLIRVIDSIAPEIIALQEVPRNRSNTETKDYIQAISERLNMNYAFGSHGFNDPEGIYPVYGEWGNAILSKYEIIDIKNIEVSYIDKWRKRSILDAHIRINDTLSMHVITLHYGLTMSEFNDGLENTKDFIKNINKPIVLMGDFNPQFGINQLSENFQQTGLVDSDSTFLHGGDRIFYSEKDFTVDNIGSLYDTLKWTSDHPANYCKLRLKN